ncbi:MAG: protein kinase domain-containing protein [Ktedonobacteraceae bacterium]
MALTAQRVCNNCGTVNPSDAVSCCRCAVSFKITAPLAPEPVGIPADAIVVHLKAGDLLENRYRILGQVGVGGFGAVYKAEDTKEHNRLVAIKEIGLGGLTSQQVIEATGAFNREVTLLSDLKHESIPRIHAHFTDAEHWYLVIDFIEGVTLEEYRLKGAGACLPLDETLSIGIRLCGVLSYLHSHTPPIIFRDVKPDNVMLTPGDRLYLIDYGVARYFRAGKSRDTIAFGSPGFAPPEQYGKAQTTQQSDIYSLGVMLYQLLTGVDPSLSPFRFPALRVLDATIPEELESLVTQMLEMDAAKRPASMNAVKEQLQHISDRRKGVLSAALPLNVMPLPGAFSFSTQGVTRYIHRSRAHLTAVHTVVWSPDGTRIASAGQERLAQVWNAFDGSNLYTYPNHADVVNDLCWSPDGRHIATASRDQTVHIWDVASGQNWLRAVALRAGFRYSIFEGHASEVNSVAWSPDGRYIASAGDDNCVLVWETATKNVITCFQAHTDIVHKVAWSPDGKHIASASIDHTVRVWDAHSRQVKSVYRNTSSIVHDLAWSPDGQLIALVGSDDTVQIWNALNRSKIFTYKGHSNSVQAVAWSPDGQYIASGGNDQTIHIWEAVRQKNRAGGKSAFIYNLHSNTVWSVAWSPDGQYIASASGDGTVHVWQAT